MNFLQKVLLYQGGKVRYGTAGTTTTTTLASQGGLLINIDSATGDIPKTDNGAIEDEKFGFFHREFATSTSAEFKTGVIPDHKVLRLQTLDATGICRVLNFNSPNFSTTTTNMANGGKMFPIKPSTKYRFKVFAKTTNAVSCLVDVVQLTSGFANLATAATNSISGTNSQWTLMTTGVFTSNASAAYCGFVFYLPTAGNISTADFNVNEMTLEEVVEPVANSLITPSPSLVSFTAVGSTDNIDQSSLTTGANNGVGFSGAERYWSQAFTPTKSKITGFVFSKVANVGSPTSDVVFNVYTNNAGSPSTTAVATDYTITSAQWNAIVDGAEFTVNLPCTVTPGTQYWVRYYATGTLDGVNYRLIARSTSGTLCKYSTDGITWALPGAARTLYFKELYYKPTTNFKASQNNLSVSVSADEDGFQYGSVLNRLTGAYSFTTPYSGTVGETALLNQILCFSQTGLMTYSSSTDINWRFAQTIVFKVMIPQYVAGNTVNLTFGTLYNTTGQTVTYSYSNDNSAYTTASAVVTAGLVDNRASGVTFSFTNNYPDGTLYIKYSNTGGDNRLYWIGMSTTVNVSSLSTLRNYPTNKDIIKQYATTLGSATTSATYRATKWGFPAIEYSATEYQFLDVDTTGASAVVAFSELGSSYTTVADGASLAITSTSTPNIFVKALITVNRLYSSSNDYVASSDKDGSLRQTLTYQVIQ